MSQGKGETFDSVLKGELVCADLPGDPTKVIGRCYQFTSEHGSHNHVLVGTILAIEISDEGGFELHVSSPRFWGCPLRSISYNNSYHNGWEVRFLTTSSPAGLRGKVEEKVETKKGEFRLL